MIMLIFSFFMWQTQGTQYKGAFDTTTQAYYQGSEIKQIVDSATDKAKKEFPVVAGAAPVVYAVGMKREIRFVSRKISLPNTTTSYHYNHNTHSGSVGITWSF